MAAFFISHSSHDRDTVQRLHGRLRAWGYDSLFLDFDPEDGFEVGQEWERELYRQLRVADAVLYVGSRAAAASRWCFAELTLARSANKPIFPLAIEQGSRLPLLEDRQWLDLTDGEVAFERLHGALRERFDPRDVFKWDLARAPYPGLTTFEAEDAAIFFGRDDTVEELLGHLDATLGRGRTVAVIGASGSGKSSLVRAGLLPRLGRLGERWVVIPPVTPGDRPVGALARALAAALGASGRPTDRYELEQRIQSDSAQLVEVVRDLAAGDDGRQRSVLLVVDQAEELVVLADAGERAQFVELLRGTVRSASPLWVLATLRSEFLSASLRDEALAAMIDESVLIGPLARSRLTEVIVGPAAKAGLEFAPGLVERIVEDTRGGDALPLLAYTLRELYDRHRRDPNVISGGDYDAIGGVLGALRRRADLVAESLSRSGRGAQVLPTLVRLVTVDAEGEPARRRLPRSALDPGEREVVQAFVDARLLVSSQRGEEAVVEVAHEALLRAWPPLEEAIDAARERLRLQAELERDAHAWDEQQQPESYLLRGERLARARRLLCSPTTDGLVDLDTTERDFYRASEALERSERAAVTRRRRLTVLALGIAVLVISGFAINSRREAQRARDQRNVAQSRAVASQALAAIDQDLDQAALLGLEAYRLEPTAEARNAVLTILPHLQQTEGDLEGHTDAVLTIAFSADGNALASAGLDGTVRLWDVAEHRALGAPLKRYKNSFVSSIAFSPDGKTLASAGDYSRLRLWDVAHHRALGAPLKGHAGTVNAVAFTPDGKTLASADDVGTVLLWNVARHRTLGAPLRAERHTANSGDIFEQSVKAVAFSPDGKILASAGHDGAVRLWDVAHHRALGTPLNAHRSDVNAVAFSPDGKTLASAGNDGTVRLWDVASHQERAAPLKSRDSVSAVAFSPDGKTLAFDGPDNTVRLWDVAHHRALGTPLEGHTGFVNAVAFSPDGKRLASGSGDQTVRLWHITRPALATTLKAHRRGVNSVAFSPDGKALASGGNDGTLRLWHVAGHRMLGAPLNDDRDSVRIVAFSPDGTKLASVGSDDFSSRGDTVRLWDVAGRRPLGAPLRGYRDAAINAVAFSPDGKTLASANGDDDTVRLWDVASREERAAPLKSRAPVSAVAFSPDGKTLAAGTLANTVRLWDVAAHRTLGAPFRAHTGDDVAVTAVAFSPDGKTLASAGEDRMVRLWDVAHHRAVGAALKGHADSVESVAFSPDGKTLASASWDDTARLWDVAGHRALGAPLRGHTDIVSSVAFSPDGKTLATAGSDGTVRLWNPVLWSNSWRALRAWVCPGVRRNLTHTQWTQLIPDEPYHQTCTVN